MSLSSRRAWIEIKIDDEHTIIRLRRSPHGERGLKLCVIIDVVKRDFSRSPHGERGLKYLDTPNP